MINYLLLISRQGKLRLSKWFITLSPKNKAQVVRDLSQIILTRQQRMCNVIEYKGKKIVYRRYASLFFICEVEEENELLAMEIIHRYVEILDQYFGNIIMGSSIFNFQKAYTILDEVLVAGEMQESSKSRITTTVRESEHWEDTEAIDAAILEAFF
ncbi:AP complex, mu/sigma subunit [Crucibulum laeve]|uniref:AP complex subunit sigma n=1 Tax=Crucibulum laeve TaxID=68775 RepID=A0A5C3MAY3_9AGAR|nr:AP complex, mu/sigma subunit [Crucibulum laeve]